MAKRMQNKRREAKEAREKLIREIREAMKLGLLTRKEIAKSVGIKETQLSQIFHKEKELYAKFCVMRRSIVDIATDNLFDVVRDRKHPKNTDISKWVVQNYKSDLDDSLEEKEGEGFEVEVGEGGSKKRPTVIRFGYKNKKSDD